MKYTQSLILTELMPTADGHQIGIITLNNAKTLNAQNIEMIQLLVQVLTAWLRDERIVVVVMRGSGSKAFCAGGDVRRLYDAIIANPTQFPNQDVLAFFQAEYSLCHFMHHYRKPILIWGDGIVMGGGLGITAAASHRIITEKTTMAMPEIAIGLFPDAGGSWFLQRMPAKMGLFLGLTGMRINGYDAILCNLADYAMPSGSQTILLNALHDSSWSDSCDENHHILNATLNQLHHTDVLPESQILPNLNIVHDILNAGSIDAVDAYLRQASFTDQWLRQAAENYRYGCPVTAALVWRIHERARYLSLTEALEMELIISMHCCRNGDFQEGVRALLVDKDKQPQWSRRLSEVSTAYIDSHFISPFAEGEGGLISLEDIGLCAQA